MNMREAIKELKLAKDEQVYVYDYKKSTMITDEPVAISELSKAILKREVILVQPNHGGQQYGYKLLKFIVN